MSSTLLETIDVFSSRTGLERCLRTAQFMARFAAGSGYNTTGSLMIECGYSSFRCIVPLNVAILPFAVSCRCLRRPDEIVLLDQRHSNHHQVL